MPTPTLFLLVQQLTHLTFCHISTFFLKLWAMPSMNHKQRDMIMNNQSVQLLKLLLNSQKEDDLLPFGHILKSALKHLKSLNSHIQNTNYKKYKLWLIAAVHTILPLAGSDFLLFLTPYVLSQSAGHFDVILGSICSGSQ